MTLFCAEVHVYSRAACRAGNRIMINPAVMLAFVGLYLVYAFKMNYVSKSLFGAVAVQIMGMFAAVYGILAVVNIITAVIL